MTAPRLDVAVGDRVRLAPHTDLWMRGMRYGTVERLSPRSHRAMIHILGDNGRRYGLQLDMIAEVVEKGRTS